MPTVRTARRSWRRFCAALEAISADTGALYYDYVESRLSAAAHRSLEELMRAGTYEYQGEFARKHRAEGKVEDILAVLTARGIVISGEARTRINSCTDLEELKTWIRRAATVDSVDQLFT
jgi:hypothetical protein